ncbi:MAG: T9SS type A sorting domain-containing protein [Bacteroidota bacterium]
MKKKIRLLLLAFFALSLTATYSQSFIDNFNPGIFDNGPAEKVLVNSKNEILVHGRFQFVDGTVQPSLAKVKPDGGVVPGFAFGAEWLRSVRSDIADAGNGKTLYGGLFRSLDGEPLPNLIRLNDDGSLDPAFQSDVDFLDDISSILVLSNGKILVLGGTIDSTGTEFYHVIQTDSLGKMDPGFNMLTYQNSLLTKAVEQSPGNYLISGFAWYGGAQYKYLIRLDDAGNEDLTFELDLNTLGTIIIRDFFVRANGDIVLATSSDDEIHIVDPNGALVFTYPLPFGPRAIAELPNGRMFVGGRDGEIAIIDNSVIVLPPFDADDRITDVAVIGAEDLIIGGWFERIYGQYGAGLVRATLLQNDISVDASFDTRVQVVGSILDMEETQDGEYILVGSFDEIDGELIRNIAKVDLDGNVNDAFEGNVPEMREELTSVEVLSDGNILVSGRYIINDLTFPQQLNGITKLSPDGSFLNGSLDFTYPYYDICTVGGSVISNITKTTADGFFALSGVFCNGPGPDDQGQSFVRLNSDGSLDIDIEAEHLDYLEGIRDVTATADGKYYVLGRALSYDGSERTGVIRANTDGSIDETFDYQTGEEFLVTAVEETNTGVYVSGHESISFGPPTEEAFLLKLDGNGNIDPGFQGGTVSMEFSTQQPTIEGIFFTGNGRIVVHGLFEKYDGWDAYGLAVLDQSGNFIGGLTERTTGRFERVFELGSDQLLVCGSFTTNDGSHVSLAKISLMETGTIASVDQNNIKVFPNPVTNGAVNIELATSADFSYELMDSFGRRVGVNGKNNRMVNFGDLPSGMYTLLIRTGGDVFYENIIKD